MSIIRILCAASLAAATIPPAALAQRARTASNVVIQKSSASYLGVGVADITDAERMKQLNVKEMRGVEVKSVEEDSPAGKAGIKEGDVILEFNGQRVEGMEQLIRMVREIPAGRQVPIVISRNGATQTVNAAMAARPGRYVARTGGPDGIEISIPPIPPMPAIPDVPRGMMSWRSTALGIESESLSSQLAEFFGVKEGVLVRAIIKNSPAEKAGMRAGDVIVKIDDHKVTTPREISSELRNARSKKTVPVVVIREKKEMTLNVTLEDGTRYRGDDRGGRMAALEKELRAMLFDLAPGDEPDLP